MKKYDDLNGMFTRRAMLKVASSFIAAGTILSPIEIHALVPQTEIVWQLAQYTFRKQGVVHTATLTPQSEFIYKVHFTNGQRMYPADQTAWIVIRDKGGAELGSASFTHRLSSSGFGKTQTHDVEQRVQITSDLIERIDHIEASVIIWGDKKPYVPMIKLKFDDGTGKYKGHYESKSERLPPYFSYNGMNGYSGPTRMPRHYIYKSSGNVVTPHIPRESIRNKWLSAPNADHRLILEMWEP